MKEEEEGKEEEEVAFSAKGSMWIRLPFIWVP